MDRSLRDQAVGQGQSEYARHKRGATQEEEVPVETAGLLKGELSRLGGDAADILEFMSEVSRP